ncbi:MAG: hypothetical protein IH940_05415 [Acidobacteria bacterium]|nr:hypothetical protein [Acidobacteriota bacterium]
MAAEPSTVLRFSSDDLSEVGVLARQLLDRSAAGWMNLRPDVEEDVDRAVAISPLSKLFSGRGPVVPMATIVASDGSGRRGHVHSVGLEHRGGPKALQVLGEAGVERPDGLQRRQDHAKWGLVLEFGDALPTETLVRFVIDAAVALTPIVLPDVWLASTYDSV